MTNNEKDMIVKETEMNVKEDLESKVKRLEFELEDANKTIKQYESAYKELQNKFNRLYGILGNQIEYSLGMN